MKTSITFLYFLFYFLPTNTYAQRDFNATGGTATGINGEITYSYGELIYTTHTNSTGIVTQGVQHSFTIIPITTGNSDIISSVSSSLYPNPTAGNLTLEVSEYTTCKLEYALYDIQGKLLLRDFITSNKTTLNLTNFSTSHYFLSVLKDNMSINSFKILKN